MQTEERLEQLAPARADEAGEADDLPGRHVEIDVLERAGQRESPHAQRRDPLARRRVARHGVLERPADHQLDEPRPVDLARRPGADGPTVAQHRDPVGDREDLLHPVRDEDDGDALRA
jgi:hypothetical protein